jgi:SAM-dependent methyltransferase
MKNLFEEANYQTFDFIGGPRRGSDSGKKYELSRLSEFDVKGKRVLDVGCNSGYFLYRMLDKDPEFLFGIDLSESYIACARKFNDLHFKSSKVRFVRDDFFTRDFNEKFDLIICFSTFHYFGELQKAFFDKCFSLLNDDGILLLEMEEFPKNDVPMVDRSERPADKQRYHYPNELMLKNFIFGHFNIFDKYISVFQGGSLYDRYFYKLQKIKFVPGKRPLLEKYQKTIIIVTGKSMSGKSTISDDLLNDNISYVAMDNLWFLIDHQIPEVYAYLEKYGEEQFIEYMEAVDKSLCREPFIDYFFKNHFSNNPSKIIIADGYMFLFSNLLDYFLQKCEECKYRVWVMERKL